MTEVLANSLTDPTSTLAAPLSSSATSLTVTSWPSPLPGTGNFRINIGGELIIVGSVSGTTLGGLTRGAEGTTAATHTAGAPVDLVLTAAGLTAFVAGGGIPESSVYVPSTGVAATDTAAIQAAANAFGENGGTILLDRGPYLLTGGSLNFTNPIHLLGTGPNGASGAEVATYPYQTVGSVIQCASPTLSAITVNADGCTFEKLAVTNTSGTTPTAGAGILVNTYGSSTRIIDCSVTKFWNCIQLNVADYSFIDRVQIGDYVNYGIFNQNTAVANSGDSIISNSSIISGPTNVGVAGIEWMSGGGLKIAETKVDGPTGGQGISFDIADGATASIALITGCSIEDCKYGVNVDQQGPLNTGVLDKVVIVGNEILASMSCIAVSSESGADDVFSVVAIGNVLDSGDYGLTTYGTPSAITFFGNTGSVANSLRVITGGGTPTNMMIAGLRYTTAARPSATYFVAGAWYYDTTLTAPLYADGAGNWRTSAGVIS